MNSVKQGSKGTCKGSDTGRRTARRLPKAIVAACLAGGTCASLAADRQPTASAAERPGVLRAAPAAAPLPAPQRFTVVVLPAPARAAGTTPGTSALGPTAEALAASLAASAATDPATAVTVAVRAAAAAVTAVEAAADAAAEGAAATRSTGTSDASGDRAARHADRVARGHHRPARVRRTGRHRTAHHRHGTPPGHHAGPRALPPGTGGSAAPRATATAGGPSGAAVARAGRATARGASGLDWHGLARCEAGNRPDAVDPSGTYGGLYQFDVRTWHAVGGTGRPQDAPAAEQTARAKRLYSHRGAQPWPVCGSRLYH